MSRLVISYVGLNHEVDLSFDLGGIMLEVRSWIFGGFGGVLGGID